MFGVEFEKSETRGNVVAVCTCWKCGSVERIESQEQKFIDWEIKRKRMLDVWTVEEMTPAQRERLISATCDDCWWKMFSSKR
jgi:hypothetical protein